MEIKLETGGCLPANERSALGNKVEYYSHVASTNGLAERLKDDFQFPTFFPSFQLYYPVSDFIPNVHQTKQGGL
jgi:hypothetical protein